MTFKKVQKPCSGAPAGLQTFNALGDNADSLRLDLEIEHAPLAADNGSASWSVNPGGYAMPHSLALTQDVLSALPGVHDSPLIARGVAVVLQTTGPDPTITTNYGAQLWRQSGCLQSMKVLGTGVYFFPVSGYTKVWGRATAHVNTSGATGIPTDARVYPGQFSGTGSQGLLVKTFRIQTVSGQDILYPFHTGFYLTAFGRRLAAVGQQGAQSTPRAMALNPRNGMRPTPFLAHQQTVLQTAPPAVSNAPAAGPSETPKNHMRPFPFLGRTR